MHEKRCKAADVAKGTGISPSVLSRYLSGRNKPSSDNILAISHYLNVTPEWLLSSSDAPESTKKSRVISSATEPLLEQIKLQKKMIKFLEKRVDTLENEKAESKRNSSNNPWPVVIMCDENKNYCCIGKPFSFSLSSWIGFCGNWEASMGTKGAAHLLFW